MPGPPRCRDGGCGISDTSMRSEIRWTRACSAASRRLGVLAVRRLIVVAFCRWIVYCHCFVLIVGAEPAASLKAKYGGNPRVSTGIALPRGQMTVRTWEWECLLLFVRHPPSGGEFDLIKCKRAMSNPRGRVYIADGSHGAGRTMPIVKLEMYVKRTTPNVADHFGALKMSFIHCTRIWKCISSFVCG